MKKPRKKKPRKPKLSKPRCIIHESYDPGVTEIMWSLMSDALEHDRRHGLKNCHIIQKRRWWRIDGWRWRHYIELSHIQCAELDTTPLTYETAWDREPVIDLIVWMHENLRSSFRLVLPRDGEGRRPARVQLANEDDATLFKLTWGGLKPTKTVYEMVNEPDYFRQ